MYIITETFMKILQYWLVFLSLLQIVIIIASCQFIFHWFSIDLIEFGMDYSRL